MSTKPTDRQMLAIGIIEKKIPSARFTGTTSKDAFEFIQQWMEKSKAIKSTYCHRRHEDEWYYQEYVRPQRKESDRERYEKYIEEISWNYVEAAGDDGWGGFAARDMARQLHPFEDWNKMDLG